MKYTADYITYILTFRYRWSVREHLIIPNLFWGFFPWELDLAVLSKSGYMTEIEIKCSRSDLLRDGNKYRWNKNTPQHESFLKYIKDFYYAVPEHLVDEVPDEYKERAGIIAIPSSTKRRCRTVHEGPRNNKAIKFSEKDRTNLYRLLSMRFWRQFEKHQRDNVLMEHK